MVPHGRFTFVNRDILPLRTQSIANAYRASSVYFFVITRRAKYSRSRFVDAKQLAQLVRTNRRINRRPPTRRHRYSPENESRKHEIVQPFVFCAMSLYPVLFVLLSHTTCDVICWPLYEWRITHFCFRPSRPSRPLRPCGFTSSGRAQFRSERAPSGNQLVVGPLSRLALVDDVRLLLDRRRQLLRVIFLA